MADPKSRLAIQIAGFANLIPVKGAIITGDGQQTTYLEPGVDGLVLTMDSAAPEGLAWAPGGGGGGNTFSDGVTDTAGNVTNDLVTGTPVDQLDVNVNPGGAATIDATAGAAQGIILTADAGAGPNNPSLTLGGAGGAGTTRTTLAGTTVRLNASADIDLNGDSATLDATTTIAMNSGGNFDIIADAGDIGLVSNAGNVSIGAPAAGVTLTAGAAFGLTAGTTGLIATAGGNLTIDVDGAFDLVVTPNRDELHTIGRNLSMVAAGAVGIAIDAQNGNLILDAGSVDDTGEVRVMPTPGAPAATRTFRIWDGTGETQQDGDINPAGGVVIDTEMRVAFGNLLDYLFAWGWITNPNP